MNLPDFLRQQFAVWQGEETKTWTEFAIYLEVGQANLSRWLAGKSTPDGKSLAQLVAKLGPGVYTALGIIKTGDPVLALVNEKWGSLSEDTKKEILGLVERAQERKSDGQKSRAHK